LSSPKVLDHSFVSGHHSFKAADDVAFCCFFLMLR